MDAIKSSDGKRVFVRTRLKKIDVKISQCKEASAQKVLVFDTVQCPLHNGNVFDVGDYRSNSGPSVHFQNPDTIVVVSGNNNHHRPITPPVATFELLVNNIPALRCLLRSMRSAHHLLCEVYTCTTQMRSHVELLLFFLSETESSPIAQKKTHDTLHP